MNQYYVCQNNRQVSGPFSWLEIQSQLDAYTLSPNALATPVGQENWQPVKSLPEYELHALKTAIKAPANPEEPVAAAEPTEAAPKPDAGCQTGCLSIILIIVLFWAVSAIIETVIPSNSHYGSSTNDTELQLRIMEERQKRQEGQRQADIERYKQEALKRR
jgi:GYF domain 2